MSKPCWSAMLIAPDGTQVRATFDGDREDRNAYDAATTWLLHDAIPRMHDIAGDIPGEGLTDRARSRFMDMLLSCDSEIDMDLETWGLELIHRSD